MRYEEVIKHVPGDFASAVLRIQYGLHEDLLKLVLPGVPEQTGYYSMADRERLARNGQYIVHAAFGVEVCRIRPVSEV